MFLVKKFLEYLNIFCLFKRIDLIDLIQSDILPKLPPCMYRRLLHQTRGQFSLEHLQQLVTKGLWADAAGYVESFLPTGPRSFDAQVLYNFLLMHHYIASFVAGDKAALGLILDNEWMHYVTYAQKADDPRLPPPVMARSVLFIQGVR
jgi:hypothetical protein